MMKNDLSDSKSLFWGAFEQSKLAGFIEVNEEVNWITSEKQLYISRLVVAKKYEGKGIAKKLLSSIEHYGKLEGYPFLVLNVFEDNHRAKKFYLAQGFQTEICKMVKVL